MTEHQHEATSEVKAQTSEMLETAKLKLAEAQEKLKSLTEGIQASYLEKKENAAEGTHELKVILDTIVDKASEGAAAARVAYENAGGAKGISETVAQKAGEFAATAKTAYENAGGIEGISHTAAEYAGQGAAVAHSAFDTVANHDFTKKTVDAIQNADITKKAEAAASSLASTFKESYAQHYSSLTASDNAHSAK